MSYLQPLVYQAVLAPQHLVFATSDSRRALKTDLDIQDCKTSVMDFYLPGEDERTLMRLANVTTEDDRYDIKFVKQLKDPSKIASMKVIPSQHVALQSAGQAAENKPIDERTDDKTQPAATQVPFARIFGDPTAVSTVLSTHGYRRLQPWHNGEEDDYICVSERQVTPTELRVGGSANDITWCVMSSTEDRVELARLTADIFNTRKEEPVILEFQKAVQVVFDDLNLERPNGLSSAISEERTFTQVMPYGNVRFRRDNTYNRGYGLILTIDVAFGDANGEPYEPPDESTETPSAQEQAKPTAHQVPFARIFGDPTAVSTVLWPSGYRLDVPWKTLDNEMWSSVSIRTPSSREDRPTNDITWLTKSSKAHYVEFVRLQANVFDETNAQAVVSEFEKSAHVIFDKLGLECPTGLFDALSNQEPFSRDMPYGKLKLYRDDSYNLGYGLAIEIEVALRDEGGDSYVPPPKQSREARGSSKQSTEDDEAEASGSEWERESHVFTSDVGTTLRGRIRSVIGSAERRKVVLENQDGKTVKVDVSRLSAADGVFVEDWLKERGRKRE